MKSALHATVLTCALLALTVGLSTPAHADNANEELVRTAQMRLAGLGFYVGRYDGAMGPLTENAIRDFQRTYGLATSGQLTPETFTLLSSRDFLAHRAGYDGYYADRGYYVDHGYYDAYAGRTLVSLSPLNWDDRWHYLRTQQVPTRFGNLDIHEDARGSLRQYEVTFNGHTVLLANNQPGILRVSQTFHLSNEDAVILTAYNSDATCAYQSYLLTLHSDGTHNNPRQIGNCSGTYEAHVAGNSLQINFPGDYMTHGWTIWDSWNYKDNRLAHS